MIKKTFAVILAGGLVATLSAQIINPQPGNNKNTATPPSTTTQTPSAQKVLPLVTGQQVALQVVNGQTINPAI